MRIAPIGFLSNERLRPGQDIYTPMDTWPDKFGTAKYNELIDRFVALVEQNLAPKWLGTDWSSGYGGDYEAAMAEELTVIVREYYDPANDILKEQPAVSDPPDDKTHRDQDWHYRVEDALIRDQQYAFWKLPAGQKPSIDYLASRSIPGCNYLIYDQAFDNELFIEHFFSGMRKHMVASMPLKDLFQRPRPWTAAKVLNVQGFRWTMANWYTHTGIHP